MTNTQINTAIFLVSGSLIVAGVAIGGGLVPALISAGVAGLLYIVGRS